jgi:hypothetical protein
MAPQEQTSENFPPLRRHFLRKPGDTVGEPTATFQDRFFLRKLLQLFLSSKKACMAHKLRHF